MKSINCVYSQYSSSLGGWIFITLIFFLINPMFGVLISFILLLNAEDNYKNNRPYILLFIITLSVWISLVNITKGITSDQGVYSRLFLNVPVRGFYQTVFNAFGEHGKEPLYSFITWALYWVTGGNLRLFFFIISLGIYLPLYFAIYKLFKAINAPKGALICSILVITFFTQYFVMTVHLIRQMLASSIVVYAIVYHAVNGKNNWWLLVVAVLIHTTSALLAILSVVPWFYKRMNLRKVCIVLACFIPIIVFNSVIASKLGGSNIETINYGLRRFGDTGVTDGGKISIGLMMMVFLPLFVVCAKLLWQIYRSSGLSYSYSEDSDADDEPGVMINQKCLLPIIYLFILLAIFVLSFTKSPLIQYRFFYYTYSFIPLLLPLLITKSQFAKPYWIVTSIFFIVRFFMLHNHSGWKYAEALDLLTQPIIFYFTGNFHRLYSM